MEADLDGRQTQWHGMHGNWQMHANGEWHGIDKFNGMPFVSLVWHPTGF